MHLRKQTRLVALCTVGALALTALAGQTPASGKARLLVRLPADASLSIGTHATVQRGAERVFESPVLPAGKTFYYELRATWKSGGEAKSVTRRVAVRAGEQTVVDFNQPEPAHEATKEPESKKVAEEKK